MKVLVRSRAGYAARRANGQCTKCGCESTAANCDRCAPRRYGGFRSRAAFLEADRREEFIALNELAIAHYVGRLPCA